MFKYFKMEEFECKCGCGKNNISPELVHALDDIREAYGKPVVINSGCRCEEHNKNEGGSPTSSHLKGLAVDIKCTDDSSRFELEGAIRKAYVSRIGIAKNFIHIDIDPGKNPNRLWVY